MLKKTEKNSTSFLIKARKKIGLMATSLKIKIYRLILKWVPTEWENIKGISIKIRNGAKMSTLSLLVSIVVEILANTLRQNKLIRGIRIGTKELKLSLFADYTAVCMENSINAKTNWNNKIFY